MKPMVAIVVALLMAGAGCDSKSEPATAVRVVVGLPAGLQANQVSITARHGGELLIAGVRLPESPRPLDAEESVVLVVDDSLGGETLELEVGALQDGQPVALGGGSIEVQSGETVTLVIVLGSESCGDGILQTPQEDCDDGNTTEDDGCSPACVTEAGWVCTGEPSMCQPSCGDGVIDSGEECDDGNTTPTDGCSGSCVIEGGWQCAGEPSVCTPLAGCGDGVIDTGEECDDGNPSDGDGCSAGCVVEGGWQCTGEPSSCTSDGICGDGTVDTGEGCDDGNLEGGDGCDALCEPEPFHGDLIAHWRFDETAGTTAADSAGSHPGTLVNMNDQDWVAGQLNNGLDFDGNDDYVSVPTNLGTFDNLTVAFWIQIDSYTAPRVSVMHNDTWFPGDLQIRAVDIGRLAFSVRGNDPENARSSNGTVTVGPWFHVAIVYDRLSSTVDFYVDGVHDLQFNLFTAVAPNIGPLRLGGYALEPRHFDGRLDDIRVYDALVTPAHIAYLAGL